MDKSIVLPGFFPGSTESIDVFQEALDIIKLYDIRWIEFYYSGKNKNEVKKLLEESNLESIYLGAMAAKTKGLNISSLDKDIRVNSINLLKECIDDAYFYKSKRILINSGKRLDKNKDIKKSLNYLKESIFELLNYIDNCKENEPLILTLEPGDTEIDWRELIGSTDLAIEIADEIKTKYSNFELTIDTSHLLQLGENPLESIKKAKDYTNHIHLANCLIEDQSSLYYGDKHPDFDLENSELSSSDIKEIFNEIISIYKNNSEKNNLIIGMEIIIDNIDKFNDVRTRHDWFFKKY